MIHMLFQAKWTPSVKQLQSYICSGFGNQTDQSVCKLGATPCARRGCRKKFSLQLTCCVWTMPSSPGLMAEAAAAAGCRSACAGAAD